MTRQQVYKAIDSERDYQSRKWKNNTTGQEHIHSPEDWCIYVESYLNESKELLARDYDQTAYSKVTANFRKIAAMLVCAMEQLGVEDRILDIDEIS